MPVHCRTCGEPIYNLNPRNLFNHENQEIQQNIEAITGIKVSYSSHLPSHICSCCYLDLNHSISFRQLCIETHNHFMNPKQEDAGESNVIFKQFPKSDPEENDVSESKYNVDYFKDNNAAFPKTVSPNVEGKQQVSAAISLSPRVRIMRCRDPSEASQNDTRPLMITIPPKSIKHMFASRHPTATPRFWTCRPTSIVSGPKKKCISIAYNQRSSVSCRTAPNNKVTKVKKKKQRISPLEKRYVCDQCGWTFSDLSNMKDHALRHSGVKKFECDECGSKFFTKPLLKLHVRVKHKGEKPFVCKYCGMAFRNSPSRCRHERKYHANELPFVCNLCSRTFISKISLEKHITAHEMGELIHRCETCNKTFKNQGTLKKHNKTMFHSRRVNQMIEDTEDHTAAVIEADIDFDFPDSLIEEIDN